MLHRKLDTNPERKEAQRQAAKQARQQAYQKAKERRDKDPRYLALKEAAKARRREHYQRVKQHRKASQVAERAARSVQRAQVEGDGRAFFRKRRVIDPKSQELQQLLQLSAEPAVLQLSAEPAGAGSNSGAHPAPHPGMGELWAAAVEVANDVG